MRTSRIALAAVLVLGLMGCAQQVQQVKTTVAIATATTPNPVTREMLYGIEGGFRVASVALVSYRRACLAGAADSGCRENIRAVQPYTRQAKPLLVQLRGFVRDNDQVNAFVVYQQLTQLYATLKATAATAGIKMEGGA